MLNTRGKNEFLVELLEMGRGDQAMLHALLSLISVIVSTLKGVEYILTNGPQILHLILQLLLKQTPDGSVNQRFCISIL